MLGIQYIWVLYSVYPVYNLGLYRVHQISIFGGGHLEISRFFRNNDLFACYPYMKPYEKYYS